MLNVKDDDDSNAGSLNKTSQVTLMVIMVYNCNDDDASNAGNKITSPVTLIRMIIYNDDDDGDNDNRS